MFGRRRVLIVVSYALVLAVMILSEPTMAWTWTPEPEAEIWLNKPENDPYCQETAFLPPGSPLIVYYRTNRDSYVYILDLPPDRDRKWLVTGEWLRAGEVGVFCGTVEGTDPYASCEYLFLFASTEKFSPDFLVYLEALVRAQKALVRAQNWVREPHKQVPEQLARATGLWTSTSLALRVNKPSKPRGEEFGTGQSLVLSAMPPVYPKNPLNEGVEGVVGLAITVDSAGNVSEALIVSGSGDLRLDEMAMRTVLRGWRFQAIGWPYRLSVRIAFRKKSVEVIFWGVTVLGD